MKDKYLQSLIEDFSHHPQVNAIAIAGSHSLKMNDSLSDYDLYIYVSTPIPVEHRKEITDRHCSEMELNNQFWETEDDGVLKSGTEIELIYRDLAWLDSELERVVFQHNASAGYSTCFWANLLNSEILFDRNSELEALKEKFSVEYSNALQQAIIAKNLPLITNASPAYPKQITKAIKRQDTVSAQHRLTEYLASYFDILFAVNIVPHPGEKRLISTAKKLCPLLPANFEKNLSAMLSLSPDNCDKLPGLIAQASGELEKIVCKIDSK